MPEQDHDVYKQRQSRLAAALPDHGLDGLILNAGPSLTYFSGLHFHLSERPVALFLLSGQEPLIVAPELEAGKVHGLPFPVQVYLYGEDTASWAGSFRAAARAARLSGARVGIEPRRLRVLELELLETAAPGAFFVSGQECMASLRMVKDRAELAAMRRAVAIAQQALSATLADFRAGVTERQLAAELTVQILRHGSDPELPFSPIVASGANSANPHAVPSDRVIQNGELLILDWGASADGYFSDLTRTFAVGEVDDDLHQVARTVAEANAAARAACQPGVPAGEVDDAARRVIELSGYGEFFMHRTGHGLGIESHEEPYIASGNPLPLQPGMTFTIEPGIYLPGRGGVRIEDNLLITDQASETFSDLRRDLVSLPGLHS
jgi:Xaa-Pro dipeptidase